MFLFMNWMQTPWPTGSPHQVGYQRIIIPQADNNEGQRLPNKASGNESEILSATLCMMSSKQSSKRITARKPAEVKANNNIGSHREKDVSPGMCTFPFSINLPSAPSVWTKGYKLALCWQRLGALFTSLIISDGQCNVHQPPLILISTSVSLPKAVNIINPKLLINRTAKDVMVFARALNCLSSGWYLVGHLLPISGKA